MIASRKHTTILLLILGIIAIAGYLANARSHGGGAAPNRLSLYVSVAIGQLLLVRYIMKGIRVPLRELIGRAHWCDIPLAIGIFFAIRFFSQFVQKWLAIDNHTQALRPRTTVEIGAWIVLSLIAGFAEELTFRGYLQRQLPFGVIMQAIVFGISHGYQGITSVINIAVIGLLFGIAVRLRKGLIAAMIAHAATDIIAAF